MGNFLSLTGTRSGRFLDAPQFTPFHDIGNDQTIFDRMDFQPSSRDAIHVDLFGARNWIHIPNSYDQLSQDQRQRVLTWNITGGYQHTFNSRYLLTVTPYTRKDEFTYFPKPQFAGRYSIHTGAVPEAHELRSTETLRSLKVGTT